MDFKRSGFSMLGRRSALAVLCCAAGWITSLITAPVLAQGVHDLKRGDKVELFLQHLGKVVRVETSVYQSLLLEYEIAQTLGELGSPHPDPLMAGSPSGDFISRTLEKLHPEYGEALRKQKEGDPVSARSQLEILELRGDPYLAAYCRLSLMEIELSRASHADAMQKADALIQKDRRFLLPDYRPCEVLALGFEALKKPLMEFLQYAILMTDYKDLPPEVQERAGARLAALQEQTGQPIRHVAGWMDSAQKLIQELKTSDEPTQKQQVEIVVALDKLIELQEARERNACQNCGKGNCNGSCRGGQPKGNRSKRPAQVSKLVQADGSLHLHGVSHGDAENVWGLLKERQGAEALQSFRGKLPERYQKLLEQYYRNLSRSSESSSASPAPGRTVPSPVPSPAPAGAESGAAKDR